MQPIPQNGMQKETARPSVMETKVSPFPNQAKMSGLNCFMSRKTREKFLFYGRMFVRNSKMY